MDIRGYLVYATVLLAGWGLLALLLWWLNKSKPKGLAVVALLGPVYFLTKHRDWKVSKRETAWWMVVLFLMLAAPSLSYWLQQ